MLRSERHLSEQAIHEVYLKSRLTFYKMSYKLVIYVVTFQHTVQSTYLKENSLSSM